MWAQAGPGFLPPWRPTAWEKSGINAAETPLQRRLGIADSKALFFADIMTGGYNLGDSSLVQVLPQNAAEAAEWLEALGADLSDVGMMAGSSVPRTHRPQGGAAIGPHLMSVLYKQVQAQGIEVRTRNRVTGLQMQDGRITGVEVEAGRTHYTIQAKAVVIATGGFGANPTLLTRYRPELLGFSTSNHAGATGDAVLWMQKAGGDLTQMDQIQVHPTGERLSHLLITEAVRGNGAILVNQEGQRFANEMLTRDKLTEAMLAQSGRHAYLVFDQAVRNSLAAIENYAQQGFLYSAQTYAQLALDLHMDPEVLEQNLADYARYQASGEDEAFGRRALDMPLPLTTPPFYAIDVEPVIHHTMGGLKIGPNAQVLNTQGLPLPGLYAAGEVTGGIHGGNRLGGNAVADIIVFGRLAGRSAAQAE